MVIAYIDDIVIATETVEDHMARLREVFECLREAGFKMRVAKCDFLKSEIKYLGRVVSAEGVKPDPKAVAKLRDWEIPRNKTEMQSFLGFANYYREFFPWHAKLVAPLHAVTGLNVTFTWGSEQQKAFNEIKKALIEATALAQPDSEGEFVLDTDTSAVAIAGILHQWQGPPGDRRLKPIVYGSKKLTTTQAKYGAPKLEMFAAYYFIVKNHSYLCPRKFTLRVDNQALSWLKTYSTDQALIGRWIMTLEKYHFRVEHRTRTQHRNADGLSKRTNEYRCREKQLAQQPAAGERWNFLSADEFNKLPVAPWFDLQGRVIPNHPDLPAHLQNLEPKAPSPVLRVLNGQPGEKNKQMRWQRLYRLYRLSRHSRTKSPIQTIQKTGSMSLLVKIICYRRMLSMYPRELSTQLPERVQLDCKVLLRVYLTLSWPLKTLSPSFTNMLTPCMESRI